MIVKPLTPNKVKALCEVEGGPNYQLELKGRASLVNYKFDAHFIDYGRVVSFCLYVNPKITHTLSLC